uniref:Uncharacterized protein n=1 Tax=Lactuca sativa TaxID=4236 RepID=A0A9R1WYN1_LACSA|nr:hypothetical protein LSAT_V11C800422110 [Lactuca sativa]
MKKSRIWPFLTPRLAECTRGLAESGLLAEATLELAESVTQKPKNRILQSEVFLQKAFSLAKGYFSSSAFCLTIVILNVQDDLDNITRFLILAREPIIPGIDKPQKVTFSTTTFYLSR